MRPTKTVPGNKRAAIYVRMSTESQNYSTDHQRHRIGLYAQAMGLEVVKEYADEGKSGLDTRKRPGLLGLLHDVQSGVADFRTIIVYDVSRWGRFQEVDEAAYHEHTCRRAGISVVYCAEQFANDGSPLASILKSIKRTMAAEYSRELSSKVFTAQCRFIDMGYKQGGHAGYGLRRLAVMADGTPRRVLEYNEAKGAVTDRVLLILGPEHEVAMVKRIYSSYLDDRLSEAAIARWLNAEKVESEFSRPWTQSMVNSVLTNLKYIGHLIFNRRSSKLSQRREHNARSEWIIKENAIERLLPFEVFERAQQERVRRNRRYEASELVALLQDCHKRNGIVTATIIAADKSLPDPQLFSRMFGSLILAYDAAGLPRSPLKGFVNTKRLMLTFRQQLFAEAEALAAFAGVNVTAFAASHTLVFDGKCTLRVEVATRRDPRRGEPNWKIVPREGADFILLARVDPDEEIILNYYLIPAACLAMGPIYLKQKNLTLYSPLAFDSLPPIFGVTALTASLALLLRVNQSGVSHTSERNIQG